MKIVIDECLPKRVTQFFEKDSAYTVPQIGLSASKDTELLEELDKKGIDVFVTIDGNIEYQQQFTNRTNDLLHLKDKILKAVSSVSKGKIERIS